MTLGEGGDVRFYRPDGSRMPEVPPCPPVPKQPVTTLTRRHASENIEIDAWTATPRWLGDRLDVDWGLFVLRQPAVMDVRANSDVSAEAPADPGCGRDPPVH